MKTPPPQHSDSEKIPEDRLNVVRTQQVIRSRDKFLGGGHRFSLKEDVGTDGISRISYRKLRVCCLPDFANYGRRKQAPNHGDDPLRIGMGFRPLPAAA